MCPHRYRRLDSSIASVLRVAHSHAPHLALHPAPPHTVPHAPAQGGTASALMAADVRVFRHEFITIFRYSHSTSVHPADLRVLERIDARGTLYEEEKGTVFLARDVMERMQRLAAAAAAPAPVSAPAMSMGMGARRYAHGVARLPSLRMRLEAVH